MGTHASFPVGWEHSALGRGARIRVGLCNTSSTPATRGEHVCELRTRAVQPKTGMLTSGVISRFVKSIHTRIGQSIGVHEARWARWWHLLATALDWRVQEHVAGSTLRSAKAQRKEVKRGSQAETRPFIRTAGGRKLRCERAEHCRTRCGDCRSRNAQHGSSAPAKVRRPCNVPHNLQLLVLATAHFEISSAAVVFHTLIR